MQRRSLIIGASGLLIAALVGIVCFNFFKTSEKITESVIVADLGKLAQIFAKIHAGCQIIGFDHQKTLINFLNVKGFSGSEVGSMNLAHPEKWEGPYLDENPTVQDQEYQVVKTNQGYFITPGEGVMLPNNKVIGKDIILDEHANITALMQDENSLAHQGQPLAIRMIDLEQPINPVVVEMSE